MSNIKNNRIKSGNVLENHNPILEAGLGRFGYTTLIINYPVPNSIILDFRIVSPGFLLKVGYKIPETNGPLDTFWYVKSSFLNSIHLKRGLKLKIAFRKGLLNLTQRKSVEMIFFCSLN